MLCKNIYVKQNHIWRINKHFESCNMRFLNLTPNDLVKFIKKKPRPGNARESLEF